MSLEKLKLLAAKPNRLMRSSGKPELTWEDVAFALNKTNPVHSLYARICFSGDRSGMRRFERELRHILLEHPDLQRLTITVGAFRNLVWLAICEAATGQSFPVADKQWPVDKIRLLNVSRQKWYRTYAAVYQTIQSVFGDMDQSVFRRLQTKLRTPVIM